MAISTRLALLLALAVAAAGCGPTRVVRVEPSDAAEVVETGEPNAPSIAPVPGKGSPGLELPPGTQVASLPINPSRDPGLILPGSKVDILATIHSDNERQTVPVLVKLVVVAVDLKLPAGGKLENSLTTISFAVTEDEARVLALARDRGCHLELLHTHSKQARNRTWIGLPATERWLGSLPSTGGVLMELPTPVAPPPRAGGDER
jgi:Flp pilus assembly protein CpaB